MFDFASGQAKAVSPQSRGALGVTKPRRMRKAWEFTWDDEEATPGAATAVAATAVAPSSARPPLPAAPRRMRKAWEFTWDDGQPIVTVPSKPVKSEVAPTRAAAGATTADHPVPSRGDEAVATATAPMQGEGVVQDQPEAQAATAVERPRRRRRLRTAEGLSSDEMTPGAGSITASDAPVENPDVSVAEGAQESLPSGSVERPRRRPRVRAAESAAEAPSSDLAAASGIVAEPAPDASPAGGDVRVVAREASGASAPDAPNVDDVDLESVRRRLESLGSPSRRVAREREEAPVEESAWVKRRTGLREVKVVRLPKSNGATERDHGAAAEPVPAVEDVSLSCDPLVVKALRIASLLREKLPEEEGLSELRRAVRDMRKAFADVEARAYLTQPRSGPPAFFQAYDPKTGTG